MLLSIARSHSGGVERRADDDALAAVGTVRLEHQRLAFAPDERQQVAGRPSGSCVCRSDSRRVQRMCRRKTCRSSALKYFCGQLRIGQHLPAAFLVQLRGDRRDHAVLRNSARIGSMSDALRLAGRAGRPRRNRGRPGRRRRRRNRPRRCERQLARVGVQDLHAVAIVEVAGPAPPARRGRCRRISARRSRCSAPAGRSLPGGRAPPASAVRGCPGRVPAAAPGPARATTGSTRSATIRLAGRHQVQAADAAQVRLDELERILPHRAGEIDHRVEPAEDRVVLALARPPALPQPLFLVRASAAAFRGRRSPAGTCSGSRLRALWIVSVT